ncbi:MAG: SpoIID/LytB domain-containing protein [Patulibacter minatonensis]
MSPHPRSPIRRSLAATLAVGGLALAAPVGAGAATTIVAKGAGFGHGIGMSQYGAYGQAKAGRSAAQILSTYYLGTALGKGDADQQVRVLLRTGSRVVVRGASTVVGTSRKLSPSAAYVLRSGGGSVTLSSGSGKRIATAATALRVAAAAGGSIQVDGRSLNGITGGRYRGAVELRGTNVINQLSLEDYVRGVVAGESPSSWPAAALQAQSIAARTYAITTSRSADFDQYPDTRSQVYRGVSGETATTDVAVAATAGQLVTYKGEPITTYFFSTSGGITENVENSFLGATPKPYLRSVKDPWDTASPKHRWQIRYTRASLQKKLGGWVKGTLRSIDVIKTGISPRVVRADIVGSRGRTSVTGPQLRARLGLDDTWVTFVFNGASTTPSTKTPADDQPSGAPGSGGTTLSMGPGLGPDLLSRVIARPPGYATAKGRVWPDGGGRTVRLQVRRDGRWRTVIRVQADATGSWRALLPVGASYRVVALGAAGPVLKAR